MILTAVKYNDILHVDQACMEELATVPNGKAVTVELKRPRNINHHRLFFGALKIVHDNVDHQRWPRLQNLLSTIKLELGILEPVVRLDGAIEERLGSIDFASMDQAEFAIFFNRFCDLVCLKILPGMKPGPMKNELSNMVGIPVSEMQ